MTASVAANPRASEGVPARGWAGAALVPGLALCALLALLSMQLEHLPWLFAHGLGALTIAIVLGIALGNLAPNRSMQPVTAGVLVSKQQLLRLGIVLYGFRLTFHDLSGIGLAGVTIDLLTLSTTFLLCVWFGTRILGLERSIAMLVGTGSSICGAAAVIAAAPVLKARAEQAAVAVATVVVFGTAATFLYPVLFDTLARIAPHLLSAHGYGLYAGSTIHEVAQAVAAGRSVGVESADIAVIEKMVRVMMLAPFLVILSTWLARGQAGGVAGTANGAAVRHAIPWFALLFVVVAGINSLIHVPQAAHAALSQFDTFLLAMAMAALGLTTQHSALRTAGLKPLLLAAVAFAWLVIGGAIINGAVAHLL